MPLNQGILKITVKDPKIGEDIRLFLLIDKEGIKNIPQATIQEDVMKVLQEITFEKVMEVQGLEPVYTPVDDWDRSVYSFNTLVEVDLPYCLHLPNGYECKVNNPDLECSALVSFKKIWTQQAVGSSEVDIFAEDRLIFFKKGAILTPKIPQQEDLGWEMRFTGKNIEKTKDNTGYFRYTKLLIQFDTNYSGDERGFNKYLIKAKREINSRTSDIVNRVLDAYRFVTQEEYVERLGTVNITNVLFLRPNIGFYQMYMGYGIGSATVNRSRKETEEMRRMLENNIRPPLYELLLLNAKSSLNKKMFTLVVVETFQALEIFLENFLAKRYQELGKSEAEIKNRLDTVWRTKERLKDLLKETTGHALSENSQLWDSWCTMYDGIRNEVIHKGKEIGAPEAERTIKLNRDIIQWVKNRPTPAAI